MVVFSDVLWIMRLAGGRVVRRRRRRLQPAAVTRAETRKLAEVMRALPGRYADRLPARTLDRVAEAAAAGEWERAVEQAIAALASHALPVSADEREQLANLADALGLSTGRLAKVRTYNEAQGAAPQPGPGRRIA